MADLKIRTKEVKMKDFKTFYLSGIVAIYAFFLVCNQAYSQVSVSGGVSVTIGTPAPVVVQPAPPAVVVQPPPPVIVVPAPPPQPVVVAPKPPAPQPRIVIKQPILPPFQKQVGLGFRLNGAFHGHEDFDNSGMGGGGLLLRLRLLPHFATEIGFDVYGGQGYEGVKRVELPVTIGLMWMPMYYLTRFQFYTIGGMGVDWARVGEKEEKYKDKPFYLGGFLGLGFELKLGPRRNFALFWDIRGFMRKRMNDRPEGPYPDDGSCRLSETGKKECTDWEGGATMSLGAILYF